MMMLRIATHEFRYMFWSVQTLISACLFFGLAFLITANGVEFQQTARGGNVFINSPHSITNFLMLFGLVGIFITPAFIANAVLKDVDSKFDGILFATPITKSGYLFGRFLGAFAALGLVFFAAPVGMFLGTFWPWALPETLGPQNVSHYLMVFFGFLLPTLFTLSAIIFAVAVTTRSMLFSYLAALGLLFLYITMTSTDMLPAVLDPFMHEVISEQTRYWTASERNTKMLGYTGQVLTNRSIWFAIAMGIFGLAYFMFSFRTAAKVGKKDSSQKLEEASLKAAVRTHFYGSPDWTKGTHWHQLVFRCKFEIMSVLKSMPFLLLMGFCLFMLFFALTGRETLYGVSTYPLTRILLGAISQSLTMALMAVLAFYSAEVIWREKTCKFSDIIDALPAPNWVFVVSKIAALALVMHLIVLLGIVIAITLQIFSGHDDIQLGRYIGRGLIYYPMGYVFLAVLTCFFQVLTKNRVIGIVVFVVFMSLLASSRDIFGVEHVLLSYGVPGIAAPLSDMNSDGRFAVGGYWLRLYWGAIAGVLLMLTYVLWNRGTLQPLKYRLRGLRILKTKAFAVPAFTLMLVFVGSGSYIFYNTNVLNVYRTAGDIEQLQVAYEQQYRQYESLPMPRIVDVKIDVDIYPYQRRVEARATQILQNKTAVPISTIHVVFPMQVVVPLVTLQGAVQKSVNEKFGHYIFDLQTPMLPGEKRELEFETLIAQQGFVSSRPDVKLVRNGTFINNNQFTPNIGFYADRMITDRNTRRGYGLPPLPRLPKLEDTNSHGNNYVRKDSDFITFETTVSTIAGQTAVSPGYLVKQWTQGDRRYFHYKMDAPIMNYYAYLSADYEVARDKYNDVDIEVFYDKAHKYNVERMIESVKDSLAYYSKAFSPYQYRQVRIFEFPAYRNFAQAYPNTIPFSEGIGFVADVTDPSEIDLPYYVTAHEVAHQWWAHQVMAANAQGGTMLVETLAQYSALLVMEKKYGKHNIRQFLKHELDSYLSGRAKDSEGEMPLYKVEGQAYIHYRKGAVIMYALKDYIGEAVLNSALKRLVKNHAYKSAPYAISTDFIGYLKEEAGPQHHGLIEDFLEKITLFDLKLVQSTVTELPDGRFKVSLEVDVAKYYEDAVGNQTEAPFDLAVDIGLFVKSPADKGYGEGDVIMLEKRFISLANSTIEVIVDRKPTYVGIDPYNKLIDRNSGDNLAVVGAE
jgi:ABC-2 type transport system permease protein